MDNMKKKKTRSIKYVKRYNARALISSLLLLLSSVGVVVALLFLPLVRFDVGEVTYNVYAINFLLESYGKLTNTVIETTADYQAFNSLFVTPILGGMWAPLADNFHFIASGILCLVALFLVIGAIAGLLCTAIGYIAGGYKAPKVLCGINFWMAVLLGLIPTTCTIILLIKGNPDGMYVWASYGMFYAACLFVIWFIVKMIYVFGLKDRIFKKHLDRIVAERNAELAKRRSFGMVSSDGSVVINPNGRQIKQEKFEPLEFSDSDDFDHFCDKYGESDRPEVVEIPSYVKPEEKEKKTYEPTPFKVLSKDEIEIAEKGEETVVDFEEDKGLPEDLKELGDHAFSKNIKLEVANIPEGIEEIGPACFANCINLKFVRIPNSVNKIRFNAFFGCTQLDTINFEGTRHEWRKINRGSNWLTGAKTDVIVCKDGSLKVNQLH